MDAHGLIDSFWLWHYLLLAGCLGVAFALALVVWWCARCGDRWVGTTVAAVAGWVAALWLSQVVRRRTRPREGD